MARGETSEVAAWLANLARQLPGAPVVANPSIVPVVAGILEDLGQMAAAEARLRSPPGASQTRSEPGMDD